MFGHYSTFCIKELITAVMVFMDYLGILIKKKGGKGIKKKNAVFSRMVSPVEMMCFIKLSHNESKIFSVPVTNA